MSELNIKFGGNQRAIPAPATVLDAIKAFDRDVLKKSVAAKVNGEEVDLNRELTPTDKVLSIEPITVDLERAIELGAPTRVDAASRPSDAALSELADRRLPFVSVLSDPTMGGVSASFAMIGDVVIAEPGALIGFAGPRVIEQTVRQKLPEGFQRAEFLLEKGAIDMIVDRRQMREKVARLVTLLKREPAPEV